LDGWRSSSGSGDDQEARANRLTAISLPATRRSDPVVGRSRLLRHTHAEELVASELLPRTRGSDLLSRHRGAWRAGCGLMLETVARASRTGNFARRRRGAVLKRCDYRRRMKRSLLRSQLPDPAPRKCSSSLRCDARSTHSAQSGSSWKRLLLRERGRARTRRRVHQRPSERRWRRRGHPRPESERLLGIG
jgi:hypothetical protein